MFKGLKQIRNAPFIFYWAFFVTVIVVIMYFGRTVINHPWTARDWIAAAAIDDKVYVLGGQDKHSGLLDDVLEINLTSRRLRVIASLPAPGCCFAAAALNGMVYVLGGQGSKGYYDQVIEVDPYTKNVNIVATLPSPRVYGGAVAVLGKLYYIGGWDGKQCLDEIVEINPLTGDVRVTGYLPSPMEFLAVTAQDNHVYVLGGEDTQGNLLDSVMEIDPTTGRVIRIGHLPSPQARGAAKVLGNNLFLLGGWRGGKLTSEIVQVELISQDLTARIIDSLPEPAADRAAVRAMGKLYLIGGTDPDFKRQIAVWEIDPQLRKIQALRFRSASFPW